MIDNMGGPVRVNNALTTLNLSSISNKGLKKMERRAGDAVTKVADKSMKMAAKEAYEMEMM